jgi:GT2 family glycosyltransferase
MRIGVGLATAGRPDILEQTIIELQRQTRPADRVIVCPASPQDVKENSAGLPFETVFGKRGLAAQRNAIIAAAGDLDAVVFFDDDYFPEPRFLELLEAELTAAPDVVVITGSLFADGIIGPGITPDEARRLIAEAPPVPEAPLRDVYNAYGCNMAIRLAPVREHGLRFEEELPLYCWLEDVDFSRAMAPYGRIVKSVRLRGVHMGTKSGRTPGVPLGYSQVANPLFLMRKGTLSVSFTAAQMFRNLASNIGKLPFSDPWVDRKGRLRGNLLAFRDLLLGRMHPNNILKLKR